MSGLLGGLVDVFMHGVGACMLACMMCMRACLSPCMDVSPGIMMAPLHPLARLQRHCYPPSEYFASILALGPNRPERLCTGIGVKSV